MKKSSHNFTAIGAVCSAILIDIAKRAEEYWRKRSEVEDLPQDERSRAALELRQWKNIVLELSGHEYD